MDLDGPVHYLDFGGPRDGPVIVCVHGLGGSAVNWTAIGPLLASSYRVIAPDLAGHGLTQSGGRGADVSANRVLLDRFITATSDGPVILMGNSMGGMIAVLEATAAPDAVAGLILIDPALPLGTARPDPLVAAIFALFITPGLGRMAAARRRRVSPAELVANTLAVCCVDVSRVGADIVAHHVELARQRSAFTNADRDFAAAVRSVLTTAGYTRGRAYRRGIRSITCPLLLVHGARDRLVPVAAARSAARANPSWSLAVLPDVGHVPQLEAPQQTWRVITEWLESAGRPAARAAARGAAGAATPDAPADGPSLT
ncbi:MAG TPA: alpha/beta hydrolase [Streptosporangiaceae bacterium]